MFEDEIAKLKNKINTTTKVDKPIATTDTLMKGMCKINY